jgi:DNA-binding transcriptional LysR family regulator
MHIDLRLLKQAQALATHRNFSRAAAELNIAQPTLSRSIIDLEQRIGLPLFTRARSGVEPTDFGHVFLRQAAYVVAQLADLEREIQLAKGLQVGEVALGAGPYVAHALLPQVLQRFAAAHPGVRLRLVVDSPEALLRQLRARTLDLFVAEASVVQADEAVQAIGRLAAVEGHFFARATHPLARRQGLSLGEVLDYPLVQVSRLPPRLLARLLAQRRKRRARDAAPPPPFPAIECPTVPLALGAVLASDGVMIASLASLREELEARRIVPLLTEPWLRSEWAILCLRTRTLGPAAMALAGDLQAAADGLHAQQQRLRCLLDEGGAAALGRTAPPARPARPARRRTASR